MGLLLLISWANEYSPIDVPPKKTVLFHRFSTAFVFQSKSELGAVETDKSFVCLVDALFFIAIWLALKPLRELAEPSV